MIYLYTFLVAALSPLLFLSFVWTYGLKKSLSGLPERLGMGAGPGGKTFPKGWLWIHAASVGEVKAAEGLLRALPGRFPGTGRLLTTTTVAGRDLAEEAGLAECVRLAPVDLPFCLNRLMDRWSPRAAVLVETELWPNWLRGLARRGTPTVLVNGRVSDRTFRRYMLLSGFWEKLLPAFTRLGVQSPAHASRFLQLGAGADRVVITGNLKFDVPLPDLSRRDAVKVKFGFLPSDVVWACGSTHPGEEEILLEVFAAARARHPGLKMILAPRHVERTVALRDLFSRKGIGTRRRSSKEDAADAPVLLLDTLGELAEAYGAAALAFVGGSLIPRGGQNPLEPARWGVPVLFGPHMENFGEMAELFLTEGGSTQVKDGAALSVALDGLLDDGAEGELRGRAARRAAESQRGALEASLALLSDALQGIPAAGACCGG